MQRTNDPLFDIALDTWEKTEKIQGTYLAARHTREMMCEALRKIDRLLETDRTRHQKIAGRRRFEKPWYWVEDENGRRIR